MKAAAMAMGILLVFAGCQRPFAPGPPETIIYLKALDVIDITPEGNRPVTLEKTLLTETVTRQLVQAGLTVATPEQPGPERWDEFVASRKKQGLRKPGTVWPVRLNLSVVYGLQSKEGVSATVIDAPGKLVLRGEVAIRLPGESESVREALKSASGGDFAGGRERYEAT